MTPGDKRRIDLEREAGALIACAVNRADLGKDMLQEIGQFQEIDQVALFQPIRKRSVLETESSRTRIQNF